MVIESGGTKSAWLFSDQNKSFMGPGLNPFELNDEKLNLLQSHLKSFSSLSNYQCYFYGSGCENPLGVEKLKEFLAQLGIKSSNLFIQTDLFGACRALFGNNKGTVAILGTGAISAIYDGEKVIKTYSGLGALLGDEGSGFDLGKRLLKAYFYEQLSQEINESIESYFGGRNLIISTVYNENGRMHVAGLTKLVKKHQDHPVVNALIEKAFEDFYTTALFPISKNGEVSLVGSIAFYFKEELESVLNKKGYSIQKIIPSADKELLAYHKTFNFCP